MRHTLERLQRAAGLTTSSIGNHSENRVAILLYHRVTELRPDPWLLAVTPRHFAEHLELLQEQARIIELRQLLDGDLPPRAVVVTFDDGYADNLHNAKPLLERYGVAATVFVTAGYLGSGHEFWWDELEQLLLQPGNLPDALSLNIDGRTYEWDQKKTPTYSKGSSWRSRFRKVLGGVHGARYQLYHSVWELMYRLSGDRKRDVLDQLAQWSGTEPVVRPTHRPLSTEEAVSLTRDGLIEIGAHTMTHPALSEIPSAVQRDEIRQSKVRLEELVDRPVTSFAYPHGNYSAETVAIARETGFNHACSISPGIVRASSNRFELPRFQVQDWGKREFARRLSWWLDG